MFRDLKADVLEVLDDALEFLTMTEEDAITYGYPLSLQQPSLCFPVPGGWRIVTLSTLTSLEQAEVLGHELGHLLLQGEGLAQVSLGDEEPERILAREINSVIAHRFLIHRLATVYQIGSNFHLHLRARVLTNGEEMIRELADEKTLLYALGLHLLDLAETTEGHEMLIAGLLAVSNEVRMSYEAGQKFLLYPTEDLSLEEQYERVKRYLEQLHYATGLLRFCG